MRTGRLVGRERSRSGIQALLRGCGGRLRQRDVRHGRAQDVRNRDSGRSGWRRASVSRSLGNRPCPFHVQARNPMGRRRRPSGGSGQGCRLVREGRGAGIPARLSGDRGMPPVRLRRPRGPRGRIEVVHGSRRRGRPPFDVQGRIHAVRGHRNREGREGGDPHVQDVRRIRCSRRDAEDVRALLIRSGGRRGCRRLQLVPLRGGDGIHPRNLPHGDHVLPGRRDRQGPYQSILDIPRSRRFGRSRRHVHGRAHAPGGTRRGEG